MNQTPDTTPRNRYIARLYDLAMFRPLQLSATLDDPAAAQRAVTSLAAAWQHRKHELLDVGWPLPQDWIFPDQAEFHRQRLLKCPPFTAGLPVQKRVCSCQYWVACPWCIGRRLERLYRVIAAAFSATDGADGPAFQLLEVHETAVAPWQQGRLMQRQPRLGRCSELFRDLNQSHFVCDGAVGMNTVAPEEPGTDNSPDRLAWRWTFRFLGLMRPDWEPGRLLHDRNVSLMPAGRAAIVEAVARLGSYPAWVLHAPVAVVTAGLELNAYLGMGMGFSGFISREMAKHGKLVQLNPRDLVANPADLLRYRQERRPVKRRRRSASWQTQVASSWPVPQPGPSTCL